MNIPADLKYTKTHEWAKKDGTAVRVGITDHAQHEITDVVHVELPSTGLKVRQGQPVAVVESVKSAFDIYSPVSGTVSAANDRLTANPELINQSPYADGFLFAVTPDNVAELDALLTPEQYAASLK